MKQSVRNRSSIISDILHRNREKNRVKVCQYSCYVNRISNVVTAQTNSVFPVTAYPIFTCDIPLCVSDMIE